LIEYFFKTQEIKIIFFRYIKPESSTLLSFKGSELTHKNAEPHIFKKKKRKKKGRAIPNMPMGYGMGYGLASYRQLLAIAAVSTERFAILLATTDEREDCLVHFKIQKVFKISHHIVYVGICMEH
jgi:hypothetical protein